jgi:hypothetical protein
MSTYPVRTSEDWVPTAPLREAFERSGLSVCELARRLDWWHHTSDGNGGRRRAPDTMRVARQLGIKPTHSRRKVHLRQAMRYERALEIAEAIDVDPHEVGL